MDFQELLHTLVNKVAWFHEPEVREAHQEIDDYFQPKADAKPNGRAKA